MFKPTLLQKRRLWLLLVTSLSVAIVGFLMWESLHELHKVERRRAEYTESFVPSLYQLDREYLRYTHQVGLAAQGRELADLEAIAFHQDLLLSRIEVADNQDLAEEFRKSEEYSGARALLAAAMQHTDRLLGAQARQPQDWRALYAELLAMAPAMSRVTIRAGATVIKEQEGLYEAQVATGNHTLLELGGLLFILVISALTIGVRQGRVERERRHLQMLNEELQELHRKADAANAGKTQFVANMSHELRTPLNGMLGMLSLLEDTPVNAQQDDYIKTATRSAKHLLALLNDILDASALEAGKMTLAPEPVCLPLLLGDVQALMRPIALEKQLVLEVVVDKTLPRWVHADGTRVKQIVLNLLSNALKFSETGTVKLEISVPAGFTPLAGHVAELTIRVSDQGAGMSAQTMSRLFQRFEQGEASGARRFGGSGLGLEISRNLARHMDGDIVAASVEGQGSVFTATLRLPVSAAPAEQTLDAVTLRRAPGTEGLRLLVAEDNEINRKYMAVLLANMGHSVRFAEHGGQAVQAVQDELPDLVLMDLHMPQVDGLQATQTLRMLPAPAGTLPIIALTADVFDESRERVMAAGMDGFLSKPVNVHALEKVLVQRFGVRGATLAPTPAPTSTPTPAPSVVPVAAEVPAVPSAPKPRRRFRAGDVAEHLDMAMLGELCVGVTLQGYQSLLEGVMRTDAHTYTDLLAALNSGNTAQLLELGHAFKGVTASLGLAALSRLALIVEKQGHSFSPAECQQAADSLRECWSTTFAICARMGLIAAD